MSKISLAFLLLLGSACSQPPAASRVQETQGTQDNQAVPAPVSTATDAAVLVTLGTTTYTLTSASKVTAQSLVDDEQNYAADDVVCDDAACLPKSADNIKTSPMCFRGATTDACAILSTAFAIAASEYGDGLHQGAELLACDAAGDGLTLTYVLYDDYSSLQAPVKVTTNVDPCAPVSDEQALAQSFKDIMGDTLVISEADYPWVPFASTHAVDAAYSEDAVRMALDVDTEIHVDVYDDEWTAEWWSWNTNPEDEYEPGEAAKYSALKQAMEASLTDIKLIKIGEPDHGELDFYVVGRTRDGKLVGLKALVVET